MSTPPSPEQQQPSTSSTASDAGAPASSIVLNVMGLRELAVYGFRSWLLQDFGRPYEVILNLFTPYRHLFDPLIAGANPNCRAIIHQHEEPEFFNVSAANNFGLHLSRGRYVMFSNADIIYPSYFLSRAVAELEQRDVCYAVAGRLNLTAAQSAELRPVTDYTRERGFDHLVGLERSPSDVWPAISPWMLRRDVALAVGGFDPRILMAEDRDLNDRVMHYLRRTGQQHNLVAFCDLLGYHQYHTSTGQFDAFTPAKAIIEPRYQRLTADPNSTEDVVPTRLDDGHSILEDIRKTQKPPRMNQYRTDFKGKLARRAQKVWSALVHGK